MILLCAGSNPATPSKFCGCSIKVLRHVANVQKRGQYPRPAHKLINKCMVYYIIYKITNKINNKIYIGAHKTANIYDGYMGSGKLVTRAIAKHGIENFTKEIMHVFDNADDMYAKEAELVTTDFIAEANTYNLRVGGFGGWDYINNNEELRVAKNKKAMKIATVNGILEKAKIGRNAFLKDKERVDRHRKNLSAALKGRAGTFNGKQHSEEAKKKMSNAHKEYFRSGGVNSQQGTMWITDGKENRKVKCTSTIPAGWQQGTAQGLATQQRKQEKQIARQQAIVQKYRTAFEYYRDNNVSLREVEQEFNISHNTLYKNFKKYFSTEYEHVLESKK